MAKPTASLSLQLSFGPNRSVLDDRAVRLLELIDARGSITHAASALGISYRTAWMQIARLRDCADGPVVAASRGGVINGSRLTPAGRALVTRFRAIEGELNALLEEISRRD
jgi:molybdate transport system regulatory protein